ncbi:hypothetical protein X732_29030 [Mesorhizobium sp. L2C066B000]|nr:hypothetical protein X732_29030 [Mesorhizobium sp. L2C066B000]
MWIIVDVGPIEKFGDVHPPLRAATPEFKTKYLRLKSTRKSGDRKNLALPQFAKGRARKWSIRRCFSAIPSVTESTYISGRDRLSLIGPAGFLMAPQR